MTREEFKKMIYDASKKDTSSPKDCIHLLSLHRFIEQIFDEHEAQLKAKESDLERQDMIIKCLNIDLDNKEKLLKAKDEEIELLKFIV